MTENYSSSANSAAPPGERLADPFRLGPSDGSTVSGMDSKSKPAISDGEFLRFH